MFGFGLLISSLLILVRAEAEGCGLVDCRRGKKGKPGKQGPSGPPGLKGPQGLYGPLGPTGPRASHMNADLYTADSFEVPAAGYFEFTSINALSEDFVVETLNGVTSITFLRTGTFVASYIVSGASESFPVVVELEMDGYPVSFSRYSSGTEGQQLLGQTAFQVLVAGSVLKLKNALSEVSASVPYGIAVSLNLVKISDPTFP